MSGDIRDLRRRIRSVKSTQQITRAMKLVAASKLRKAQEAMEQARPYTAVIRELLGNLTKRVSREGHPLLEERDGERTLLVVVAADRGLCGSFNANVFKGALRYLESNAERDVSLQCVGRKTVDFFKKRSFAVRKNHLDLFRQLDYSVSKGIADELMTAFKEEGFDEVLIISNRFKTVMTQDLVLDRLLPAAGADEEEAAGGEVATDYIYEPSPAALLSAIVPRSIETIVHQALLESYASEMGARMVAMEAATKNAGEMIDHLTLVMNRKRQAAITTEIIEVVSGASALEG